MSLATALMNAYTNGQEAGKTDKRIGLRSDYAYFGFQVEKRGTYAYAYSCGYRDGWNGR